VKYSTMNQLYTTLCRCILLMQIMWYNHAFLSSYNIHSNIHSISSTRHHVSVVPSSTDISADLTPAVDKFPRLPPAHEHINYLIQAKSVIPKGPDPFSLVADELSPLSDYVKELVVSENPVLTMAASHFFEKVNLFY
jgi:hypothetical protein